MPSVLCVEYCHPVNIGKVVRGSYFYCAIACYYGFIRGILMLQDEEAGETTAATEDHGSSGCYSLSHTHNSFAVLFLEKKFVNFNDIYFLNELCLHAVQIVLGIRLPFSY